MGIRSAFARTAAPASHGRASLPVGSSGVLGNLLKSTGGQPWEVFGYSGLELYRGVMSIPAFWRGSLLLADLLAQVGWDAYTTGVGQDQLVSPRPPLLAKPSPPFVRFHTFRSMMLDYLIHGNAVAVIASRDGAGVPTSIWPMPARWVWNRRIQSGETMTALPIGAIEYNIAGNLYPASDILHIMGPSSPGALRGFGILEAHNHGALATAHEQQRQARNGARPGVPPGYIKVTGPDPIDGEDLVAARDEWMRKRDEGGVAALNSGIEFQAVSWNPDEAQMIEGRQLSLNEIANLLGLPATFVNSTNSGGTSLTYTTVDSEALVLLKWSMGGHFANWEQTLSELFPDGTCVKANMDHFLRGDTQSRYTAYFTGISAGWLRRSEVRALENLPPVDGIDDLPLPSKAEKNLAWTDPKGGESVPPPGEPIRAVADRIPELPELGEGQRAISQLQLTPHGRNLWNYWTGEGKARWAGSPKPYTTLTVELAKEGVPAHEIPGLAAEIFHSVFHMTPSQHAYVTGDHHG
jgi:HK97 family phage portal protein